MDSRVVDGKLDGFTSERLCAAIEWRLYLLRKQIVQRKRNHKLNLIKKILVDPEPKQFYDSEELFMQLQSEYPPREPYGYDPYSTWRRASKRANTILSIPDLQQRGKKVLEVAAGDGITGRLLHDYGHEVTLCDIEDWRDPRAKNLSFLQCDVCQTIPLEENSFDLICSYNAFEHLPDPHAAFEEMRRLCKPQGFILLSFNPLYYSPWGLHAYRALKMPYPQFLFSHSFIDAKIKELRIYDLGKDTDELQPLNKWRLHDFQLLWRNSNVQIVEEHISKDWSHLDFIIRFANAFRNSQLAPTDLVADGIYVLLRQI